jgi:hypothetical protein
VYSTSSLIALYLSCAAAASSRVWNFPNVTSFPLLFNRAYQPLITGVGRDEGGEEEGVREWLGEGGERRGGM